MPCQARAESDQYRCALCRIVWDRNDPDPPKCPQEELEQFEKDKAKSILTKLPDEYYNWGKPKSIITKLSDEATDESFGYVKTLP